MKYPSHRFSVSDILLPARARGNFTRSDILPPGALFRRWRLAGKPVQCAAALLIPLLIALLSAPVFAQRTPPVVDGNLWLSSSTEVRKAFLVGAGNMLALESAYAKKKGTQPPVAGAMISNAVENLTLDDISNRITRWYETHPDRRNMPVMGVVWIDMVRPAASAK